MIKNALLLLSLVAAAGCGTARAGDGPPSFQGVVELETYALGFDQGGRLEGVAVTRGDRVEPGQPLARLDAALLDAARAARGEELAAARAEVALLAAGARREDLTAARAQVTGLRAVESAADKAASRVRALREAGSLSQAELDEVEARLARARAEREAAEARVSLLARGSRREEVAVAEARAAAAAAAVSLEDQKVQRCELRSPMKGTVLDVHVKTGEVVGLGAPAVTVADPTRPFVEVFVPEGDLDGIRVGARAELRVDGALGAFAGVVEHIAARTEFTPRYLFSDRERPNLVVRVRVRIDDPGARLHAGVPARVAIARGGA
jgi:HlyD family secretion protein